MAEVGIIASILQIADTGLRLSLKLYTFGEIVSIADRSVISISKDVSLTSSVLKELGQILIQDEKSRICSENAVQTADDIVKECLGVFEEMERVLVKKLPHLGTHDGEKAKRATVLLERLRWPYLQPKLELMRSNLERLKSTLNLMLNVISLARQQADRKESPEIIAGQRTLIEDLARSNDDYVRKFEQMKLSIDSARSVQSEGYDTSTTTLLSNSPDTRSIGDGPLLNAALKSSHAEPKLAGFTTAKVAPGQYSADFLGLLLEHYHTLMGKLLQKLHAPEYQIPIESRSRIREDIIGTHTREIERAKTGHGYGQSHELLHSQRLTHQRLPGIQDTSGFLPPSTASDTQPLGRQSQQRESQATSTSAAIAHCYDRNYTVRHDREARRAELQAYWGRSRSGSQSALSHNERAHDAPSGATEDLDLIEYGDIPIKYDNVVHDHYSSPIIQRGYHISVQATIIPTAATGGEEQAQPQQQHQQMTAPQMAQQTTSPEADNATMGNVCRVHHSRLPSISAPHDSPDFRRQTEHQRVIQQQQQPQRTLVRKNAWKLSLQQAQQNISTKFGQGQHASAHAPQESFQEGLARKRSVPRRRQLTQGDQSALIPPLEIRGVNAEGEIALPKSKLKRDAVRGSESMSGGTSAEPTRSPTRNTEAMIGPSSPLNLQQSPQKLSPIQPHDLFTQANNDLPNKRKRWRSHRVGEDTMAIADSKQASQSTPTGSYQFESKPRESQHSMSSNSDTTRGSGDHNSDRKPPSDFLNKEGMAGNSTNEIEHLEVEQGDLRPARASMTYNESPASSSKSYPLSYHDSSYPSSSPLYSSYSSKIGNREEKSYPEPVVVEPPKIPQCWDQGCNGRRFSVFSNLLRHQREMSKIESKPICDSCGAQFTRQTARDNHAACDSCRNRLELEEASRIARSDGPLRSYVTTAVRKCRGRLAKREPPLLEAKGRNSLEQITQGKAQPGAKEHGDLEVSNQRETRSRPRVSQFVGEAVQTTPSPAPVSKDGDSDAKRDTRDTCEDAHESVAGTGGEQVPEDTSWLSTTDNELDDTDMEMQMDFDLDDGHVLDPLCSFNSSLGVDHDQVTIRNFEASSQNQSPKRRKVSAEPPINDNSQSQDEPQHIPPRASNGEGDIPETQDGRSVVDELLAQWTLSPTREVIN